MKKKIIMAGLGVIMCASTASANALDNIEADKAAHFAVSYLVNDQLKQAGMNDFWAGFTTLAIGAAKEAWIDDHFDRGDFAADCAGVLFYQIRF